MRTNPFVLCSVTAAPALPAPQRAPSPSGLAMIVTRGDNHHLDELLPSPLPSAPTEARAAQISERQSQVAEPATQSWSREDGAGLKHPPQTAPQHPLALGEDTSRLCSGSHLLTLWEGNGGSASAGGIWRVTDPMGSKPRHPAVTVPVVEETHLSSCSKNCPLRPVCSQLETKSHRETLGPTCVGHLKVTGDPRSH